MANPPIIHYSHIMRILKIPYNTEPGTVVYRIKASDADSDDVIFDVLEDYGKTLIRFDKINKNEANVVLICPLTKHDEYNLTIYANTGEESTYVESRLIATDVEDKPQKELNPFIIETDPVYVFENSSLNNSIALIKAYEQDNSELPVTFEFMENEDIFHFRYIFGPRGMSVAEIILLNPLDYEKKNLYILKILAINGKTRSDLDTRNVHQTQLTVVVKDIQDTPPKFKNLPETHFITNSYQTNQTIFQVFAEDGDATNKRNVTFSIKKPHDRHFKITPNGSIWSPYSYDELNEIYDVRTPITIKIEANEIVKSIVSHFNNSDSTSSSSQLIIVFDLNNRRPTFSKPEFRAKIDENSPFLTSVVWPMGDPQVVDPDYGFNGTFELNVIDPTKTFVVSPKIGYRNSTFTLLVNNTDSLDYEKHHNLSFIINAKDLSQKEPLEANVTGIVFINDVNDNFPEFNQNPYRSKVLENAPAGTIVAQLKASDKDTGIYGQVRFTGIKGSFAPNFEIDPISGIVTLVSNENLDREMVEEVFLTIEARDNLGEGNLNTTELYLEILDVNDNPPLFLQPYYVAILKNNLKEFLHPLKVDAIDIDQINTTNSIINYEILQGNYENIFMIDRSAGKIRVKPGTDQKLSLSSIPNHLSLTVRAYDLGIPQMSSQVRVHIYILNSPNYLPTLFSTNQILDIRNGNSSLEKSLSMITGGNVTVKELRSPETPNEPITIVTMVRYQNENTINLDKLASAYQNLFFVPPTIAPFLINEEKNFINKTSSSSQQQSVKTIDHQTSNHQTNDHRTIDLQSSDHSINDHRTININEATIDRRIGEIGIEQQEPEPGDYHGDYTGRTIRTASTNLLNILMYILLFLILLLLLFLLCLCCYLCKKRRFFAKDSETILDSKNMWYLQSKKNSVRPSQQEVARNRNKQQRRMNKRNEKNLMAINGGGHIKQAAQTVAFQEPRKLNTDSPNHDSDLFRYLERRFHSGDEIEYEIKEEKKYSNTPKTMTYTCKKVIRPKITESKQVDILNLENGEPNVEHRLFQRKKISAPSVVVADDMEMEHDVKMIENGLAYKSFSRSKVNEEIIESGKISENLNKSNDQKYIVKKEKISSKNLNIDDIEQYDSNESRNVQFKDLLQHDQQDSKIVTKSHNMHNMKNVFSIAYNGVQNRENFSSESNKTLGEWLK